MRCRWLASAAADDSDDGVDADGCALGEFDLGQRTGGWRRDLRVHLVGGYLKERLVSLELVANLLEPLGDGAFGDGFPHLRHGHVCAGSAGRSREWCCGQNCGRNSGRGDGGCGSRRGRGCWGWRSCTARALGDDADDRVDLHRGALGDLNLLQRSRRRGGNLGVHLVGGYLEERLVALDLVANLLEPFCEGTFGDRFAHLGHNYVSRHRIPSRVGGRCKYARAPMDYKAWDRWLARTLRAS